MPNLEAVRADLLSRAEALTVRVGKIGSHLRGIDREAPADWTDRAQFLENDQVLEALEGHDLAELLQIRTAVRRLRAGTYGTCEGCGGPIPVARLEVLPTTTLCVRCAD